MERINRIEYWSRASLVLANAAAEKGKIACVDTADGLVHPAQAGTTLRPVGTFDESFTGDGVREIGITLFREVKLHRFNNSSTDAVDAADAQQLCYLEDDQTLAKTDDAGTLSAAGRVWSVTPKKRVDRDGGRDLMHVVKSKLPPELQEEIPRHRRHMRVAALAEVNIAKVHSYVAGEWLPPREVDRIAAAFERVAEEEVLRCN